MATNLTNYDLPSNAYLGFDAQNLNELMIQKLNEGGTFTDQIYEGSNFSALLDVTAYAYHLLLFYLNKMGAESTYTQTQLYENMNRLVKIIGFKPIGYQTSCVSFNVSAPKNFTTNYLYTIPRFAYINVNGIKYSLVKDINFSVPNENTTDSVILLKEFSDSNILFQGEFIEHEQYAAKGDKFETYTLIPANLSLKEQTIYVDHANFSVFVYNSKSEIWEEYTETSSLYLENSTALKYEKRLNEAGYYEFKFGDNVYGRKLEIGDVVQIYYLKSDGTMGEIGINQLNGNVLNLYRTTRFINILANIGISINEEDTSDIKQLQFTNDTPSTKFTLPEDVDTIRLNSGKVFRSNSQLITSENIQTHIERNFNNIVSSCYVMDNKTYLNDVMSYYYQLGLDSINLDSRIAFNQVQFSTSCNFNNVYVYMVPRYTPVNDKNIGSYIDSNLKQYIVTQMEDVKPLTCEIIPMDPIYMAVGFAVQNIGDTIFTDLYSSQTPDDIINSSKIILTRFSNSHNKASAIKAEACNIIKSIFNESKLGYTIPLSELSNMLLNINGIKSVHTERNGVKVSGLSIMVWNPVYYNKDIKITANDVVFDQFKYPFLYNSSKLEDYIDVVIE